MDSPIFNKVKEAAEIVQLARTLEDHALSPHSVLMKGREDSYLHVDYVPETGGITLAFVGALLTVKNSSRRAPLREGARLSRLGVPLLRLYLYIRWQI